MPLRRLLNPLLLAASLVLLAGCGSVIEVAVDLHEDAETADVTVTVLGDEQAMFARFTLYLDRTDPRRAEAVRQAAMMDTTGDVGDVLDEAGVPQGEFDDYVAHVLEHGLLEDGDSYAEVERRREAGTLTFQAVERGAMRGQAMTVFDVAVEELPETLEELARIDRDSSLQEVTVRRDGDAVTVAFATGREEDGADLSSVSPFQHDLVVTVPGEVIDHNAKEVDGARLRWNHAATAEPTVTFVPGPSGGRDAEPGPSPQESAGTDSAEGPAGDEARAVPAGNPSDSLSFGAVLAAVVGVALIAAIVLAVVLDRRARRSAPPVALAAPAAPAPHAAPSLQHASGPQPMVPHHAASGPTVPSGGPPAGWYGDPAGQARLRWWDGAAWTEHLA